MRCPNPDCSPENEVIVEGDLIFCEECQGMWKKVRGRLRQHSEPRGIVNFVPPELEDQIIPEEEEENE